MRSESEVRDRLAEIEDMDDKPNRDYVYGQRIALEWVLGQLEFDDG